MGPSFPSCDLDTVGPREHFLDVWTCHVEEDGRGHGGPQAAHPASAQKATHSEHRKRPCTSVHTRSALTVQPTLAVQPTLGRHGVSRGQPQTQDKTIRVATGTSRERQSEADLLTSISR